MATKLYIKRGSKNYKEQRMLDELRPIIDAEMQKNPGLDFTPATNFEELEDTLLKQLHQLKKRKMIVKMM